jgi:hypothetical protein
MFADPMLLEWPNTTERLSAAGALRSCGVTLTDDQVMEASLFK